MQKKIKMDLESEEKGIPIQLQIKGFFGSPHTGQEKKNKTLAFKATFLSMQETTRRNRKRPSSPYNTFSLNFNFSIISSLSPS